VRRVLNGKVYDTEKATPLAEDKFGRPGNFNWWYEVLYRTVKGSYFLYGEGGAMTKYRCQIDSNSYSGDSRITPLTPDEAFTWCQEHEVEAEVIEREFSYLVEVEEA